MALTLEITPELERDLREAADKAGVPPDAYVVALLQQELGRGMLPRGKGNQLSHDEAALLQQINQSLSGFGWQRYHELLDKRRAETLISAEQMELIALSDQIEAANAKRIEALAQLAHLRHTTVDALMTQLGLKSDTYA